MKNTELIHFFRSIPKNHGSLVSNTIDIDAYKS